VKSVYKVAKMCTNCGREYGGLKLNQAKRLNELERENVKLKRLVAELSLEKQILKYVAWGKLLSPERRRSAVRHACRLLGQWRGTQRYEGIAGADEDALTGAIIVLASEY
jgi:hypothetical protein